MTHVISLSDCNSIILPQPIKGSVLPAALKISSVFAHTRPSCVEQTVG